ncbi:MAG: TIGR01777 family oxidoreductase, partial [Chloroflexota bacterium]|nr:TIGR01777 family oxidoreductase [Chloroflexota bacterium]
MNILISGASGLIGSALVPYLQKEGHHIVKLTRNEQSAIFWDPEQGHIQLRESDSFEAVIHLAGENIADGRWNARKKERIRSSRIEGTTLLARTIAALERKPRVMLSASGIGIYGHQAERMLTEADPPGEGFLIDVSREWESATHPAQEAGIRVVHMRIAPVLSLKGGMLKRMVPFFKLGTGASLGTGKQYMSWIIMDDVVRAIDYLLNDESLQGPVNLCTPNPVTNN